MYLFGVEGKDEAKNALLLTSESAASIKNTQAQETSLRECIQRHGRILHKI
jgi:hypothetical protein